MTPHIAKIGEAFEAHLRSLWPSFERCADQPIPSMSSPESFRPSGTLFVVLQANLREDSVKVEIGWSLDGVWPQPFMVRAPAPESASANTGFRFRAARLGALTIFGGGSTTARHRE